VEAVDGGTSQMGRLAAEGVTPDVVTISVGATDVGLPQLIERCRADDCAADDPGIENAIRVAQEMDLASVYEDVARGLAAASGKTPEVVVTAYPYLFADLGGKKCSEEFSADEALAFNALVSTLNGAANSAVIQAQEDGFRAYLADGTATALTDWSDLTLCSDQPGVSAGPDGVALNQAGAGAMGKALARWSQGRSPAVLSNKPTAANAPTFQRHFLSGLFEPTVKVRMDARPVASFANIDITPADRRPLVVKPGQELRVRGHGYAPGTTVTLMLYLERPVMLGTFDVDDAGAVDAATSVPAGVPVGATELALLGVTAAGQSERIVTALGIEAPVPLDTAWFLVGAVAALLVAAVAALIARRRLRRVRFDRGHGPRGVAVPG
jgi:lysophospholipase L1-like esterase